VEGIFKLGDFKLHSGQVLAEAQLAYETHGSLNAEKSNVILYPTWYAGRHDENRGAIGPGKAMDPDKYFIIVPDMFCNGLSSSPSNTLAPQDGPRFPRINVYDNVIAQHKLLTNEFGIEKIKLVAGFSMSAQQAFHWGALYPHMVEAIAPICGTAKTSRHNWLFLEGLKCALKAAADFLGGEYKIPPELGLKAFSTIYAGWFASQTYYRESLDLTFGGQKLQNMEEFLNTAHQVFAKNDANDLLGMLDTWQSADLSNHTGFNGDLKKALSSINCRAIVMPSRTDLYFPPEDNKIEVDLMPNAELNVIPSVYGHLAGGPGFSNDADDEFIDKALKQLLL